MVLGKVDNHAQENEIGPLAYTIYKINSKWIKDFKHLNIRPEIVKLLEKT